MDANQIGWIESPTHWCNIYGSGDLQTVKLVCQEYCLTWGLCVTVTPSTYIYTGGLEEGYCIGLINYPKFPCLPEMLTYRAKALGIIVLERTFQHSVLIQSVNTTFWYTRRSLP